MHGCRHATVGARPQGRVHGNETEMLGDVLVSEGLLSADDIERTLEYQSQHGGRFGECVVSRG